MQHNHTRQRAVIIVTAAFFAGLALRLLFLGSKSLWLDEALSLSLAMDPKQLLAGGFDHSHPPLYYTLLHYWLPLGESEFMLRLSSVLLGSIAILLSYALAVGLGGHRIAFTTIWLAALSPLLVWYAQELRSYTLLLVFGLVVALALVHLVSRPQLGWWLLFIIAMSAALYTHYAALLLVVVQIGLIAVLYLQGRARRQGVLLWLAGWPIVLLLYWPWVSSPGMRAFFDLLFTSNLYPIEMLASLLTISPTLAGVAIALVALLLTLVVLIAGFSLLRRGPASWNRWATSPAVRYGLLLFFLAITVFSVIPRLYTVKKMVLALWPYGLLVMAWVFPWRVSNRIPVALLLTASLIGSMVNVTLIPKDQWRDLAAYLGAHSEPTDTIWILPNYQGVPLGYYFTHPAFINLDEANAEQFSFPKFVDVSATASDAELTALVDKGKRVWLIYHAVDYRESDPERRLEQWLMAHLTASHQLRLYRIEATLYSPKP